MVFICIFLIAYDVEHNFCLFIFHMYISFGELSVHVFLPFKKLGCLLSYSWVLRANNPFFFRLDVGFSSPVAGGGKNWEDGINRYILLNVK